MFCPSSPTNDCPDCEVLAAYIESGLPRLERRHVVSHLASCGLCISVINGVVKTLAALHANRDACDAWRSSRDC